MNVSLRYETIKVVSCPSAEVQSFGDSAASDTPHLPVPFQGDFRAVEFDRFVSSFSFSFLFIYYHYFCGVFFGFRMEMSWQSSIDEYSMVIEIRWID